LIPGCTSSETTAPPAPESAPTVIVALAPEQIFADNADAVFTVYAYFGALYDSIGSGFFVDSTGMAVTNHHVIAGEPNVFIRTHNGGRFEVSGYYSYDANNDLAIIQVVGRDFPYLTIGDSDTLVVGERVFAIGSPRGYHNTFSDGIISRFEAIGEFDIYRVYGMIQMTTPISPGSSGGALLNGLGQLVGITTAGYDGHLAQALNFAVPSARIDITAITGGRYNPLPIGDARQLSDAIASSDLYGSWNWDGGWYDFFSDGSGDREWDAAFETFDWRIWGSTLILSFPDGSDERWDVDVVNANEITVGGAFFARDYSTFASTPTQDIASILVGSWDWDGGWYDFYSDGSGEREWDDIFATFQWSVANGVLTLRIDDGTEEQWPVTVINTNEITIGEALFIRY